MAGRTFEETARVGSLAGSFEPGRGALAYPIEDTVVTEEPLEIRLVHRDRSETVSVTMRTPTDDAALAAGFLFTEGLIHDPDEIEGIDARRERGEHIVEVRTRHPVVLDPSVRRRFLTSSSCGLCGRSLVQDLFARRGGAVSSDLEVEPARLVELPALLRNAQTIFDRTGGLHAAGLFGPESGPLAFAEDIGRHNAVDKVIGRRFLDGCLPDDRSVLQVSGRVSFEIVQKAAAAGIPVVSAVSAPSSLAVTAADRLGVTLLAFVRKPRFNIYSHPERVRTSPLPTGPP